MASQRKRNEGPSEDGASEKAEVAPERSDAAVVAPPSLVPSHPSDGIADPMDGIAVDAALGGDSLDGAPDGMSPLRRALKSAVRVLTKERSFTLGAYTPAEPDLDGGYDASVEASDDGEETLEPSGLSGHTSTVAIPEVLGFLAQLQKTGALWIWNEHEQYRVQLLDGHVAFARNETPLQGSLLGEILVEQGAIDAEVFEAFLRAPREEGPLGDALLKAGLVDKRALAEAVQRQAQTVFNRAYGLEDAYFSFDANAHDTAAHGIRISVTQMLFESARERDESQRG